MGDALVDIVFFFGGGLFCFEQQSDLFPFVAPRAQALMALL